jgi:hypothetical protein
MHREPALAYMPAWECSSLAGDASLVVALARRVARIEIGEPVIEMNNVLRGLDRLPARLVPA